MANGEQGIADAVASGDPLKVAAAHAAYAQSMSSSDQKVKPLSDFIK